MTPMRKLLVFGFVITIAAFALNGCRVDEEENTTGPGSAANPLPIPPGTTVGGVANFQSVHYTVTLTQGAWNITLSGMTSDADLYVYNNNAFVGPICQSLNVSTLSESCTITVPFTTAYYIRVSAFTFNTTPFLLSITPIPGAVSSSPIAISPGTVSGFVPGGVSIHYVVTLVPSIATVITLAGMTADADLHIYTDAAFSAEICSPFLSGTATETCTFAVGATASYYIRVHGFSPSGTPYTLTVTNP